MTYRSKSIYKLSLVAVICFIKASSSSCPVLECWFVQEKAGRGGGLAAATSQEKSLLHIRTDAYSHSAESQQAPSDINPDRVYFITDPAATLCHRSLNPPRGSVNKPHCEINPFLPQPSTLKWVAPLTDSALSPIYLQADWFSTSIQGLNKQLAISTITRAPTAAQEPNVILSVTSKTVSVQSRLGEPVLLDCGFWADPPSPLSGSGFAVEWRYQFRGDGRLVLAYDGKTDRLADTQEEGATLDFEGLHRKGNASLILQEAKVRHSGMYICTVYLPYLVAQVAVELEVVEPPSLSIYPSALPLAVHGQTLTVQCEASGFAPLSLELSWEFKGTDGKSRPLGSGSVTGHRQAWDGTYSQSTRLELDTTKLDLGRGGEVTCVAVHLGGTRRASVTLNVIGFSTPSIEDSMAMVGVALVLYGLIKFVSWTFTSSGSDEAGPQEKVMLHFKILQSS
ncbi:TAP binding protein (tapasin), tandem duplicate 1 isoform X1 [Cottoperca gobio]|uniref:Tapasin-like isoform X1 n=1 Tax=Cottoperca gobio TaxID=56716 RepID=A0A6J2QMH8_COTGO|nr:tapasin-like isoform X1 [Cottoperca gobio]XP_029298931.1 tapasin-like isoform X1 [Cottoperca gobio]